LDSLDFDVLKVQLHLTNLSPISADQTNGLMPSFNEVLELILATILQESRHGS
jgi:hypothetical protein